MKSIILVTLALVAMTLAVPVENKDITNVKSLFTPGADGSYVFGFENSDGSVRRESGVLKEAVDEENKPHLVVVVKGSFEYPQPDGTFERIEYFADETGFHADGPSIPKASRR